MGYVDRHACPLPAPISGKQILEPGDTFQCPMCTRNWFVSWISQNGWKIQPQWNCATPPGVGTVAQQVAAINARGLFAQQVHTARADGVTVALGASVDVTFTWGTAGDPFPDTGYLWEAPLPPSLLGKVTVTEKARTVSSLTLTLKANTLAVTAFTWTATAWRLA